MRTACIPKATLLSNGCVKLKTEKEQACMACPNGLQCIVLLAVAVHALSCAVKAVVTDKSCSSCKGVFADIG